MEIEVFKSKCSALVIRMAARFVEETESGRDGSATEPVITAGVNRSGKKRLVPL